MDHLQDSNVRSVLKKAIVFNDRIAILLILGLQEHVMDDEAQRRVSLKKRATTRRKAAQLIQRFRNAGFYVECFNDELEFMKKSLNGYLESIPKSIKLVYSVGAENTGPGTRSLVPAFCSRINIRFINSNAHARSLVWHKYHNSLILSKLGIPVPETWQFDRKTGWQNNLSPDLGKEVIVKPTYEAWAVGVDENSIRIVDDTIESYLLEKSQYYAQPMIVQEFIIGRELYVPIIDLGFSFIPDILEVGFIKKEKNTRNIQTFQDNISDNAIEFTSISNELELCEKLKKAAIRTMKALEISCVSRIDFRVNSSGDIYIFDIAEVPSLHPHHAFSIAVKNAGFTNSDVTSLIIASNLLNYNLIN